MNDFMSREFSDILCKIVSILWSYTQNDKYIFILWINVSLYEGRDNSCVITRNKSCH
jgi:hypothetical protein